MPSDPAAYPLKIVLPAITAADPACDAVCNEFEPFTMYGIAVDLEPGFFAADGGRQLSVLVPPPWKFVSGGCGEACPHPCLSGYQEYNAGRSCGTIDRGGFGFATGVTVDRPTEVLIERTDVLPVPLNGLTHAADCASSQPPPESKRSVPISPASVT